VFDVAVIIVTYRCARLTIASLRALQNERSNPELSIRAVVVDNASDDLAEISRAVDDNQWSSWVTLVAAPKNGGFAYGNNLGIECACGIAASSFEAGEGEGWRIAFRFPTLLGELEQGLELGVATRLLGRLGCGAAPG
jgi:N-acetylglucosaminyl-diphospho-decaprenol L-rhamnosyltransferase